MVKGQSALEYMMTYGWAILIIVIVVVILYSMGIFNPRGAVTAVSTGFAPFTIASTLCNSTGLYLVIHASFPGNIQYAYLNKIYFTSAVGTNITSGVYPLNGILIIAGSNKLLKISNVKCVPSGISFAITSKLNYNETINAHNLTFNATGTLAGTSS